MKRVLKYLFPLCVLLLIACNQLFVNATTFEGALSSFLEDSQSTEINSFNNSDEDQLIVGKSPLSTADKTLLIEVREFEEEEEEDTSFLKKTIAHDLYFVGLFSILKSPYSFYNTKINSFFAEYTAFSSYRRYILFESFRI